jgi:hypothetical protein
MIRGRDWQGRDDFLLSSTNRAARGRNHLARVADIVVAGKVST